MYGVAHRLKRVKRDAHGKNDAQRVRRDRNVQFAHGGRERDGKEIEIFEKTKNDEIGDDAASEPEFSPTRIGLAGDAEADDVVQHARKKQERQKPVIPPAVKQVAGDDDQDVAGAQIIPQDPVQQKESREKLKKNPGIKEHANAFLPLTEIDSCAVFHTLWKAD